MVNENVHEGEVNEIVNDVMVEENDVNTDHQDYDCVNDHEVEMVNVHEVMDYEYDEHPMD